MYKYITRTSQSSAKRY